MRRFLLGLFVVAIAVLGGLTASADIVTFDNLTSSDILADGHTLANGYAGITWGGEWSVQDAHSGYNPTDSAGAYNSSPLTEVSFTFSQPVIFEGLDYAGYGPGKIEIELFYNGNPIPVWTSPVLSLSSALTHLSYSGLVDKVTVVDTQAFLTSAFYVIDNVAFQPVPEPGTFGIWSLLGSLGVIMNSRWRKRIG
jgi:hypothetical protein